MMMSSIITIVSITLVCIWAILLKPSNSANLPPTNSPLFSAILVFGGSQVDTGNNNFVSSSTYKANYLPYGIDYSYQIPTGRFCNGKIVPDFFSSKLGLKDEIPPFLDPKLSDDELSSGVSFASAGAGFDDLTFSTSNAISILSQISLFQSYIHRLSSIVGEDNAKMIISNSLVIANTGTFDNLRVYLLGPKNTFDSIGVEDIWLNNIKSFISQIYKLGCRTVVVTGLSPYGCLPVENQPLPQKCTDDQNKDSLYYNDKLKDMLPKLQATLNGSRLIYGDIYKPLVDMINYPQKYGFVETRRSCCTAGLVMCNQGAPICQNTSQFLFWDKLHPTEAANRHIAVSIENEILPQLLNGS